MNHCIKSLLLAGVLLVFSQSQELMANGFGSGSARHNSPARTALQTRHASARNARIAHAGSKKHARAVAAHRGGKHGAKAHAAFRHAHARRA